jgi:translation initiation factor RLI1
MLFEAALLALLPTELVANTVKVYEVNGAKLFTVIVPEPAVASEPVMPLGEETAVYDVIATPPLLLDAV